jgi:hypothetical protein
MSEQPIGPLLDALGVTIELEDNQQLTEVVVLAKGTDFDSNETALVLSASPGCDWIAQRGLVSAAQHVLNQTDVNPDE